MTNTGLLKNRISIGLVLLMAISSPIYSRADDLDNITFTGVVRDVAGAVLAGAEVRVRHIGTAAERGSETDERGSFRLLVTAPGEYEATAVAVGFAPQVKRAILASAGRKINIDFTLAPAALSEQVRVSAATAPLLDTTRTVVGDTVVRQELEHLPIFNRDPLQLIFLLGGTTEAPLSTSELAAEGRGVFVRNAPEEAGLFTLTGAPATSNNITIDGLDNNDDRSARERIRLAPESLVEVQVISNQYSAEYGRASGGRVNLRTRSGDDGYRGEGYFFFGDEALNANTYFRNARGLKRVPQSDYREGGTVSGPLRKERHFFLAAYERLDVTDFAEINTLVPVFHNPRFPLPKPNHPVTPGSLAGLLFEEVSTPETTHTTNVKFDLRFTQQHYASCRADLSRGQNRRGFGGGSRLPDTILIAGRDSDSVSYTDDYLFTDRLINQLRFQHSRLLPRNRALSDSVGVVIDEPTRVVAGAFTGSDSAPAFSRLERRLQLQENLSYYRGNHLLKIGFDLQVVRSNFVDRFATGGLYEFATVEDFQANLPSRFLQRFDTESRAGNTVFGLFLQDEWKMRANLTVSFGLRWDRESILTDRDNFSPRLAIAWDPSGASKTVVRAGFGIFYNRALLRTIDDFSLGKTSLTVDSDISPEILTLTRFPQPILDRSLVDRFSVRESNFLRRISPGLEIPHTLQTGFGIEREVRKNLVVTADYIFTRGVHLWRESNINAPQLPSGFATMTDYLLSRDFDNRPVDGKRPLSSASADVVRFDAGTGIATTAGANRLIHGVRVLTLGVNALRSGNLSAALNAVRSLRPDPSLTQVEQLEATGNSFYHGGIVSLRYRVGSQTIVRASYTLAKLLDEGTTNTASPQALDDRRAERALSLQDQRHRLIISGVVLLPRVKIHLAPMLGVGSAKPFNIGAGFDRNLNDIENDRPDFITPLGRPVWRRPGDNRTRQAAAAEEVKAMLQLAPLGSSGNLPRNYGVGPGTYTFNLRASRDISPGERLKVRPAVDVFNVLNRTTFSFGAEFIDRDDADFLRPRRTQRPRTVQVSIKLIL